MPLPKDIDYFEAIHHPLRCFRDDVLRRGQAVPDPRGKPVAHTGQFADVYEIRCAGTRDRWAVKCFTRELVGLPSRYHALNEQVLGLDTPFLTPAEYHEQGMLVRGRWYPIVKMRWVDGQPLNQFVLKSCAQPKVLLQLAELWQGLARDLRRAGVAHGNLQHNHVLVCRAAADTLALQLLDYDGVFVSGLAGQPADKVGHPNYQHPQRLAAKACDADGDRFPFLAIYVALRALAVDGVALWERFDHGDNLLFRAADFQEPAASALFRTLWRLGDPVVRSLAGRLLLACYGNPADLPLLEELAAGGALLPAEEAHVQAVIGNEVPPGPAARSMAVDEPSAPAPPPTGTLETDEDGTPYALVVDDGAALAPPPAPSGPSACAEELATGVFDTQAVAVPPTVLTGELEIVDEDEPQDGPEVAVYHLEAWMPEQVAVIKLKGFVRDKDAEVVESVPGKVRVRLLDRYYVAPDAPTPGVLSWLGLAAAPRPEPRLLAELEMRLKHKETEFKRLLDITVRIRPGDGAVPGDPDWHTFCDRTFCELRGYLMG
jgi:hypothetical protein